MSGPSQSNGGGPKCLPQRLPREVFYAERKLLLQMQLIDYIITNCLPPIFCSANGGISGFKRRLGAEAEHPPMNYYMQWLRQITRIKLLTIFYFQKIVSSREFARR
jgi:hypothetical protein